MATIAWKETFVVARKVLVTLQDKFLKEQDKFRKYLCVEAYSNGREQGFHIVGHIPGSRIGISFSQNRNGEQIVVYVGTGACDFTMQGNVPNDNVYKSAKYFPAGDYDGAARYIYDCLVSAAILAEPIAV